VSDLMVRMSDALHAQDYHGERLPLPLALEWGRDARRVWSKPSTANRIRMVAGGDARHAQAMTLHVARWLGFVVAARGSLGGLLACTTELLDAIGTTLDGGAVDLAAATRSVVDCKSTAGESTKWLADGAIYLARSFAGNAVGNLNESVYFLGGVIGRYDNAARPDLHAAVDHMLRPMAPEPPDVVTMVGSGGAISHD